MKTVRLTKKEFIQGKPGGAIEKWLEKQGFDPNRPFRKIYDFDTEDLIFKQDDEGLDRF